MKISRTRGPHPERIKCPRRRALSVLIQTTHTHLSGAITNPQNVFTCRMFKPVTCYGLTDCLQVLLPEVPDFVFGSTSGRPALRLTEPAGRSVCSNTRVRCFGRGLNIVLAFRSSTSTSVTPLPVSTAGWLGLTGWLAGWLIDWLTD